jgi:hypothetical protein
MRVRIDDFVFIRENSAARISSGTMTATLTLKCARLV